MRNSLPEDGRLKRYFLALACVAAAFLLIFTTWPFLKTTTWAPFIIAVMVSAWFGGYGPSLFAVAASAVVGQYFLSEPYGSFSPGNNSAFRTFVFLVLSLFVSFLVSTKRRAERVERAERRRFQATVASIGDAVIATDGRGRVSFMNEVAEDLTSWSGAEAKGRPLEEIFIIVNETTRATVENPVQKVLETGRTQGLANHTILISRDGSERPIDDSAAPIRDDGGRLLGVVLVFRDITDRKRAEEQNRRLDERRRLALDAAHLGAWNIDPETRRLETDERFRHIWSGGLAPIAYEEAFAAIHPEDQDRIQDAVNAAMNPRDPKPYSEEFRVVLPTGETRWVAGGGRANFEGEGPARRLMSFDGTVADITARKQSEEQLRDALSRLDSALNAGAIATWTWDIHADRVVADKNLARLFSVSPEDAAGGPISSYVKAIHPGDRERISAVIEESIRTGAFYQSEYRLVQSDGSIRWVDARGKPQYDESGLPKNLPGVAVDITERKRAEDVFIDQKHILELVAGGSPLSEVLDALCLMVEGHSGNTLLASVLVLDKDGRLRHGGAPSLPEAYNRAIDGIFAGPGVGSCGTAVHRREPVFVADIETDPLWADFVELAVSHNLRACWSIPIISAAGEVLGTFAMYHPSPRHPHPGDLHLVDIVTRTAAIAIERERAEGERQRAAEAAVRRGEQLQRLAGIANRINSAHDVQSVLGVVTEEARILFSAHQAATSMVLDAHHPQPVNVVSNSAKYPHGSTSPNIDAMDVYEVVNIANGPIRLTRAELDADPNWAKLGRTGGITPNLNGWLAAPLMGRNGKNMGLIQLSDKKEGEFTEDDEAILVQLSQLTSVALQNARLYQELRTNDERKDEFLAMLAHELRNPLAAISNAVKLTAKTDAIEHREWSMEVITRQMEHLSRLIDDLMDVSRITRGKIELRRGVMDVTPILQSAANTVGTLVGERKHTLELAIDRGGLWANVDPTRLEQVVVNLLNNAAKYSENEGHIRLSARIKGDEVVISVKDRGVGIPPERLPEMFELFAQGDRSLARSEGGLGIGLTVVKKLVEMHGGSIGAKSEGLDKGSEFVIRIPAASGPEVVPHQTEVPTPKVERKARILVVDDNVDTARGMARLLKLIGHEVVTAHDGPEAIEVAKEFGPEFILLDIGLPGMSGYEVASKLRKEPCCGEVVIVAVSGYGQDEDRRRSKESGFDFHLTKPLDHDALLTLLSAGAN